jgi:uncharacterized protein (TIGR00299 family) protein
MKILFIDVFSGISGDKTVASLLSLEDDNRSYLLNELSKLSIKDDFKIEIIEKSVMGINSIKFNVRVVEKHHHHRGLKEINKIIDDSSISENAKNISKGIFEILGKAEAKVHNTSLEKIHFHEVGAIDSIVDIVSTGILVDKLKVDKVYSSKIAVGSGFVKAAHGVIPVPAPATVEILKDIPIYQKEIKSELTTPTGASIIKYLVDDFIELPELKIKKIGYGAGSRDLEIPNVLRIFFGDSLYNKEETSDFIVNLQSNFDDCSPEQLGFLFEKLFEKGALEVFITPVIMKKGRQGQLLTVLCDKKNVEILENEIFLNSTTFGIRKIFQSRTTLEREEKTIQVEGIPVRIKLGRYKDKIIHSSLEYESVKKAVNKLGIPYNEFVKKANKVLLNEKF